MSGVKGITLIELLIVISIVGAIALFGWINLYQLGGEQDLKNAALAITALLRDAQQRSITQVEGRYWGVKFEKGVDRDRYFLFSAASPPLPDGPSVLTAITLATLKRSLKFDQPSIITFDQIDGGLVSPDCPSVIAGSEVRIKLVSDGTVSSTISVFCNGRIEFR